MSETFEAIYDFEPQSQGDIRLKAGNKVEVHDRFSENWWKGKNLETGEVGVFPSNYVKSVGGGDEKFSRPAAPLPQQSSGAPPPQYYGQSGQNGSNGQDYPKPYGGDEKSQYQAPPPANWGSQGQGQGYNNYGPPQNYNQPPQNYNNYGPPQNYNNNYGPPQEMMPQQQQPQQQQQQQPQQQQEQPHRGHPHLSGIAKRFGDSVVFGAGATLGSDLINKIF